MKQITKKQALELFDSKFWEKMSYKEIAMFQFFQKKLCMPFDIFHGAVEKCLKRPVFTHEFGFNWEGLKQELLGKKAPPTFEQILELIPKSKRIVIV